MSENKTPWCPHVRQAIAGWNAAAFKAFFVVVGRQGSSRQVAASLACCRTHERC